MADFRKPPNSEIVVLSDPGRGYPTNDMLNWMNAVKLAFANVTGGATMSDTPPANPHDGDIWFCTLANVDRGGNSYISYTDANGQHWVAMSKAGNGTGTAGIVASGLVTAVGGEATLTVGGIPAGGQILELAFKGRDTSAAVAGINQFCMFNGDNVAANYDSTNYGGATNAAAAAAVVAPTVAGFFAGVNCGTLGDANAIAQLTMRVNGYADGFRKVVTCLSSAHYGPPTRQSLIVNAEWNGVVPITSSTVTAGGTGFAAGSTFSFRVFA